MTSRSAPPALCSALYMHQRLAKTKIAAFAQQHNRRLEDYFYLPLRGKNQDIVLALSAQDGMPAGWISISPWLGDYQTSR